MKPWTVLLCLLFYCNMQPAFAAGCGKHSPSTFLSYSIKPTKYIRSVSSKELTSGHSGASGKILGLAGGDVGTSFKVKFKAKSVGDNLYCLKVVEVKAKFFAKPVIHIANNFKRGTCEYNNVLRHERKHVKILKKAHKDYLTRYRKHLRKISREIPVSESMTLINVNGSKDKLVKHISARLSEYMKVINAEVAIRQRKIDTPEAYRKEQVKCHKWDKKLAED